VKTADRALEAAGANTELPVLRVGRTASMRRHLAPRPSDVERTETASGAHFGRTALLHARGLLDLARSLGVKGTATVLHEPTWLAPSTAIVIDVPGGRWPMLLSGETDRAGRVGDDLVRVGVLLGHRGAAVGPHRWHPGASEQVRDHLAAALASTEGYDVRSVRRGAVELFIPTDHSLLCAWVQADGTLGPLSDPHACGTSVTYAAFLRTTVDPDTLDTAGTAVRSAYRRAATYLNEEGTR
jgi:hypothetical protein